MLMKKDFLTMQAHRKGGRSWFEGQQTRDNILDLRSGQMH